MDLGLPLGQKLKLRGSELINYLRIIKAKKRIN